MVFRKLRITCLRQSSIFITLKTISQSITILCYTMREYTYIHTRARKKVLKELHSSQQGWNVWKVELDIPTVFWPTINADMDNMVSSCEICCNFLLSKHKEPIINEKSSDKSLRNSISRFFQCSGRYLFVYIDQLF